MALPRILAEAGLKVLILEEGPLQTAATCTTIVEADLIRIEAARKQSGFTYLPYIARATIETLREFPGLNATLENDAITIFDRENYERGAAARPSMGCRVPTA